MRTQLILMALAALPLAACGSDEEKANQNLQAAASDSATALNSLAAEVPDTDQANALVTESVELTGAEKEAKKAD